MIVTCGMLFFSVCVTKNNGIPMFKRKEKMITNKQKYIVFYMLFLIQHPCV